MRRMTCSVECWICLSTWGLSGPPPLRWRKSTWNTSEDAAVPEVWIIAANTFREILRRKVIYVLLLLGVLMIVIWLGQTSLMNMASEADEPEILLQMKTSQTRAFFGMWSLCTAFLGLFLGAVALATEIRTQTIVPVLVRPIRRWAYLVGKWLGTQLFVCLLLGLGIGIGLAIIWSFELEVRPLFWFSMLEMFAFVTLFTGVSLGLSVVLNPDSGWRRDIAANQPAEHDRASVAPSPLGAQGLGDCSLLSVSCAYADRSARRQLRAGTD